MYKKILPIRWLLLLGVCSMQATVMAQPSITSAEWYLDNDPGYGKALAINLAGLPELSFNLTQMDTLSSGLHSIGMRSRDANGTWSADEYWLFLKSSIAASTPVINRAEWYVDLDPGYGNAQMISLASLPDLTFTYNRIDTLGTGLHIIGMRSRDANAAWSQDERWLLLKATAAATVPAINYAEWFVDADPGYNKAHPVALATLPNLAIVDDRVDTLVSGLHVMSMRSKDANGTWSQDKRWLFLKASAVPATPNIIKAEYYLDTDTGYGKNTAIPITPGQNLNLSFTKSIPGLPVGIHIIGVRSMDANNTWSQDERYLFNSNGVLPVTGLEITAAQKGKNILVGWSTLTELNSKSFTIEKSTNGINFTGVSTFSAAGNSSIKINYYFTDKYPADGINYYRVKQVDIDGRFTYSAITSVLYESVASELAIYPNPAKDVIQIRLKTTQPLLQITIYDAQGRWVKFSNAASGGTVQLNVSGLLTGLYHIKIDDGKKVTFGKFVKQ